MKRFIPQFVSMGFPEMYAVLDQKSDCLVGEPRPRDQVEEECARLNRPVEAPVDFTGLYGWVAQIPGLP